jgi:hypothetical protein
MSRHGVIAKYSTLVIHRQEFQALPSQFLAMASQPCQTPENAYLYLAGLSLSLPSDMRQLSH